MRGLRIGGILAVLAITALTLAVGSGVLAAPAKPAAKPAARLETAVLAGGCFWCMETDMKAIPGVVSVESGYTGGKLRNPSYEDVLTEKTGHYEAVRVKFNPDRITYPQLMARYWRLVDPTDAGGQFCDRGPSYKTAVFVSSALQRQQAEASRAEAATKLKRGRMTTEILPLGEFWPAEAYHRNYAKRNPAHYAAYRAGCGRDRVLAAVWGQGVH